LFAVAISRNGLIRWQKHIEEHIFLVPQEAQ